MGRTFGGLVSLVSLLFVFAAGCDAQSVSGYFAGGTAVDSSAGPLNTFGAGTIYQTPRMGGFFETIGGDMELFHGLGFGAEGTYRNQQAPYAGLAYKPSFFDVNAVYRPRAWFGRVSPEVQAGYGRANLKLYYTPQICATLPQGCGATNAEVTSVSDSEWHFAAGARFYAYRGIFVRPEVDLRHVPNNFSSYFGSSWITQYSVGVGYTFDFSKFWKSRE